MSGFTFNAYVLSIIDSKRICVRVDKDDLNKVTGIYRNYSSSLIIKDTIIVNVSECRFSIDIEWAELTDLIGIHISVNAVPRKYNYWKTKEIYNGDEPRQIYVQCKGASIIAKKISNIRDQ